MNLFKILFTLPNPLIFIIYKKLFKVLKNDDWY